MKQGFKVVEEDLCSVFSPEPVEYSTTEFTERPPNSGYLAVFEEKEHALTFLKYFWQKSNGGLPPRLFTCEYEPYEGAKGFGEVGLWCELEFLEMQQMPNGTKLAEKVRLLKEVEWIPDE